MYVNLGLARAAQLTNITVKFYEDNRDDIDADMRDFDLSISIVKRLGIVGETNDIPVQRIEPPQPNQPFLLDVNTQVLLFFTPFGDAFLSTCLGPLPPA
jgi:hypothetical protein